MLKIFINGGDANGSTHYTSTPPPKNAKRLGSISTYQNKIEQSKKVPRSKEQIHNPYSFSTTAKIELTAAERAAIEIQVKQQLQKNQQTLKQDPYANMFGSATEQDIRSSIESASFAKERETCEFKSITSLNEILQSSISNDQEDKILIWKLTFPSNLRYAVQQTF
jgi:ribosomal protein L9